MKKLTFIIISIISFFALTIIYGEIIAPFLGIEYTEQGVKQAVKGLALIWIVICVSLYSYLKKIKKISNGKK